MLDVRHEEVFDARQRARARHGIDGDDDRQHDQHRHHELGYALDAVFHAREDDRQRQHRKNDEAELRGHAVRDERAEIAVSRELAAVAEDILGQVFDDPAADDRVIRHDEDGDDRVDPAAEFQPAGAAERVERANRALAGHAAERGLCYDHGIAERHGQNDVDEQENTAAVFGGQIRKAPDVAEADGRAGGREHKADLSGKRTSFVFCVVHGYLLSSAALRAAVSVYHSQRQKTIPPTDKSPEKKDRTTKKQRPSTGQALFCCCRVSSSLRCNRRSRGI